jgi:hypothetical protein
MLLVLDNFEQVLEAAPAVTELLTAPQLKILVTSRIPLRLYGEHEYAVPPLQVPDPRRLPDPEAFSQYEAVRLFIERAEAAKADFTITSENAPAIAEICARLDGLPLTIELAAARIKLLPPKAMLGRLGNRMKLLKGGARDLPARQQTLRGAIDWSHDLLEEEDKTLFARGRTLEAIEEICDPKGELDTLEGVESLLEKSLMRHEEGPEGEPRFGMLETIHEYARESLVLNRELGVKANIAESLEIVAGMAGALGDDPRAARLWGRRTRCARPSAPRGWASSAGCTSPTWPTSGLGRTRRSGRGLGKRGGP